MIEELKKDIENEIKIFKNRLGGVLKEYDDEYKILIHKKTNLPIEYTVEIIVVKLSVEEDYGVLLDVFAPDKTEGNFAITFDLYRSNGPIIKTKTITVDNVLKNQKLSGIFSEFEGELIEVLKTQYLN